MIKLIEDEKVILRNLPECFKWIARDEDGRLFVYSFKPLKTTHAWMGDSLMYFTYLNVFNHLFSFIKWEDEEPYLIEDLLKL